MKQDPTFPIYSFWPIFVALGAVLIAIGIVSNLGISVLGLLLLFASVIGWVWENRAQRQEQGNDE
jgi:Flp pilus assembly protein TadB